MSFVIGSMIVIHGVFCNGEAPSTVFLGFIQPQRQTAEETVVGMWTRWDLVSARSHASDSLWTEPFLPTTYSDGQQKKTSYMDRQGQLPFVDDSCPCFVQVSALCRPSPPLSAASSSASTGTARATATVVALAVHSTLQAVLRKAPRRRLEQPRLGLALGCLFLRC